jgi:hypothetical protein
MQQRTNEICIGWHGARAWQCSLMQQVLQVYLDHITTLKLPICAAAVNEHSMHHIHQQIRKGSSQWWRIPPVGMFRHLSCCFCCW